MSRPKPPEPTRSRRKLKNNKRQFGVFIDSLFLNALPVPMLATVSLLSQWFSKESSPWRLPKMTPNMDLSWTSFWEASWSDLGRVFGSQDGSQIGQKSIKIDFPSLPVSASFFTWIFVRFLCPTSIHWISKTNFSEGKTMFFQKCAFR